MFVSTGTSAASRFTARRSALVVFALFLGMLAALVSGAGSASAAPATHQGHHSHHGHCHHGNKHHGTKHHGCKKHHKHHRAHPRTTHHTVTIHGEHPTRSAGSVPTRTSSESSIAQSLLNMLNRERADHRLPALSMDSHLQLSARQHNLSMARSDEMSHQLAGESDLGTRETRAGYNWSWAGENIGWNSQMDQDGVLQLETMMYNEKAPNDGHRQNILNSHFKNIGVDVYFDKAHNKVWLTTDFGRH